MFTGIVTEVGRVEEASRRGELLLLSLNAPATAAGLAPGDSIAVSGCCLTATEVTSRGFRCELTPETLRRTAFEERLVRGAPLNLERPLRADGRLDGHLVQGHVDGVGRLLWFERLGASAELRFEAPAELMRFLVEKGSLAVDGVSLTVANLDEAAFSVALIPYTLENTTLGGVAPGARVNLEIDVVAKYVERMLGPYRSGT